MMEGLFAITAGLLAGLGAFFGARAGGKGGPCVPPPGLPAEPTQEERLQQAWQKLMRYTGMKGGGAE